MHVLALRVANSAFAGFVTPDPDLGTQPDLFTAGADGRPVLETDPQGYRVARAGDALDVRATWGDRVVPGSMHVPGQRYRGSCSGCADYELAEDELGDLIDLAWAWSPQLGRRT